jgi:hypothetical protein
MTTITLDYNPQNTIAQKTLDYILSLGIFKETNERKECDLDFWATLSYEQQKDIELGISEINNGKVVDYETFIKRHQ